MTAKAPQAPAETKAERLARMLAAMPKVDGFGRTFRPTGHVFLSGKSYCDQCSAGLPNGRSLSEPCA